MGKSLTELMQNYRSFRDKYAQQKKSLMHKLAKEGQTPKTLVVACSDSRVDPAILLQCDPGDLFVVRNVANIFPSYKNDINKHGNRAAIEYAVRYLKVKDVIILGHSNCGGIQALLCKSPLPKDDFITSWVSILNKNKRLSNEKDFAKSAILQSYNNCLSYPWIKRLVDSQQLKIHLWYLDISKGSIMSYDHSQKKFSDLVSGPASEAKIQAKL